MAKKKSISAEDIVSLALAMYWRGKESAYREVGRAMAGRVAGDPQELIKGLCGGRTAAGLCECTEDDAGMMGECAKMQCGQFRFEPTDENFEAILYRMFEWTAGRQEAEASVAEAVAYLVSPEKTKPEGDMEPPF